MIKALSKYCETCKKETTHEYCGKKVYWLIPLWSKIAWRCIVCGSIHIQDTAQRRGMYN